MQTCGVLTCTRHWNDWQESYCLGCRSVQRQQGWGAELLSARILGKWGNRARVSPGFCCDPVLLPSPAGPASKDQAHRNQKTPTLKRLCSCTVAAMLQIHSAQFHEGNFQAETQKGAETDLWECDRAGLVQTISTSTSLQLSLLLLLQLPVNRVRLKLLAPSLWSSRVFKRTYLARKLKIWV